MSKQRSAELKKLFATYNVDYYIGSYMRMEDALVEIIDNKNLSAEDMRFIAIEATQSPDPRGEKA